MFLMLTTISVVAQQLRYAGGGSMGDNKFQLVYQLTGANSGGTFTAPSIEGAKKLYQSQPQNIGSSSSTVIVNGQVVEHSSGGTYRYTVTYKAERAGRINVGTASVTVNGKKVTAPGFSLSVTSTATQSPSAADVIRQRQQGQVNAEDPFTQGEEKEVGSNDLFVRIQMSKDQVYEQQAVVCTIKLYTKFPISEFIPLKQSEFTGFLIEDITPKTGGLRQVENYNGQNYYTAVLRKCILYPQKSGTLTINSGEFQVTPVQRRTYVGLNSAIAVPIDGDKLHIKSNSASVNIKPLPSPAPAGFTGAVGEFTVTPSITPSELKTYAAATYTLTVSGSGNIKYIKAPTINFPKEFDTYDPQNKINTSAEGDDVHGTVTFTYQFIPQYEGKFTIAGSEFVYFNPSTGQYETLKIPEQTLTIGKGNGQPSSHYKDKRMTDINPIHDGDLELSKTHSFYVDSTAYWLFYVIPLLIFIGILIYYRKLVKERANESLMRKKRASKLAQKRLKQAKKFMQANDKGAFYAEVLSATWGYLSDKLGIPGSELSKENINTELENYGVEEALRTKTLNLLDKCEFAQYAPELENEKMETIMDEAATVMDQLESVKRKKTVES